MRFLLRILLMTMMSCILISGCNLSEKLVTRQLLKKMIGSTVVIPEKVTCIQEGNAFPMPEDLRTMPKLIVFVDSTECSKCRIDKLIHYSELFTLSEETDAFKVMILLSTPKQEYSEIYEHLLYSESRYPIYMDDDHAFRRINPSIPDKLTFHTVTVNENNEIILVGDPVYNEIIMDLFNKSLGI